MTDATFLFLSQEDVIEAGGLEMAPTIDAVEKVLRLHSGGQTILPPKSSIRWSDSLDGEETLGRIMAMPAYVGGAVNVAGFKWIPSVPTNPARGLPRGIGLIVLTDPATGLPLAVMDGTIVSAMRTGAVTGVSARLLAQPGTSRAAILGAGVQAKTQLMALDEVLTLEEVFIWDVDASRAEAFCERHARPGRALVPVGDPEAACRGASVVVAATLAPEPFVQAEWLGEGNLFVSISSLDPTVEVVLGADIKVCDSWEHESGHPSRPFARAVAAGAIRREQVAELGDLVAGRHPGRTSPNQRAFVSPVGLAIEDVAVAHRAYRLAAHLGLGTRLELWKEPLWI